MLISVLTIDVTNNEQAEALVAMVPSVVMIDGEGVYLAPGDCFEQVRAVCEEEHMCYRWSIVQ